MGSVPTNGFDRSCLMGRLTWSVGLDLVAAWPCLILASGGVTLTLISFITWKLGVFPFIFYTVMLESKWKFFLNVRERTYLSKLKFLLSNLMNQWKILKPLLKVQESSFGLLVNFQRQEPDGGIRKWIFKNFNRIMDLDDRIIRFGFRTKDFGKLV